MKNQRPEGDSFRFFESKGSLVLDAQLSWWPLLKPASWNTHQSFRPSLWANLRIINPQELSNLLSTTLYTSLSNNRCHLPVPCENDLSTKDSFAYQGEVGNYEILLDWLHCSTVFLLNDGSGLNKDQLHIELFQ